MGNLGNQAKFANFWRTDAICAVTQKLPTPEFG